MLASDMQPAIGCWAFRSQNALEVASCRNGTLAGDVHKNKIVLIGYGDVLCAALSPFSA